MTDLIKRYNNNERLSGIEFLKLCVIHWKEILRLSDGCTSIVELKLKALKSLNIEVNEDYCQCFACEECGGNCRKCMLKPLLRGNNCLGSGEYYGKCCVDPSKDNIRVFVEAIERLYEEVK